MAEQNDKAKKETLKVAKPGRLQLTKTVESGQVKQNFTHGRSKSVTVEVRKTRTFTTGAGGMVEVKRKRSVEAKTEAAVVAPKVEAVDDEKLRNLTPEERELRLRVLKNAEEELKKAAAAPKPEVKQPQEDTEAAANDDVKSGTDSSGVTVPANDVVEAPVVRAPDVVTAPVKENTKIHHDKKDDKDRLEKQPKGGKLKLRSSEERRGGGKLNVQNVLSNIEDQRVRSLASIRRQREKALKKSQGSQEPAEKVIREVIIPEAITVQELANRMAERAVDVVKSLMKLGVMATASQSIDADTAELVVEEFGHNYKRVSEGDVENVLTDDDVDDEATLVTRPPVVTIMGHVDHGKTSLLDALRKTDVVAKEAGGITQHIGAYQVKLENDKRVTFLDTPGHEAFTSMRARGAKITDIVVLVVAADDGIMEQTKEAIVHAKAAEVPIIVAVNKIDKPGADINRVKQELMNYELIPEDFGGDIQVIGVSAKTGENLDALVEALLLQAEIMELKANPNRAAAGIVVEARLDQGKGAVATILVQKGTLKTSDIIVAGPAYGKVRGLTNDKNQHIKIAEPGMPVVVLGLNNVPEAGDTFSVVESDKAARDIAEYRERSKREQSTLATAKTVDNLFGAAGALELKELPIIIKGDVQGSVEAINGSLAKFATEEVAVRALHSGVGGITESDITLAKATGAMIIAFNVRAAPKAKEMATRDGVPIRYYSVIYNVVDDVKAALSGMLSPTIQENFAGYAEIREVFNVSKSGKVAGCMVTEGTIKRGNSVRLLRDNVVIHEGTLKTLKRFKDEVKEVKNGLECGMAFENYEDIRIGDQIEAFEVQEIARTVE